MKLVKNFPRCSQTVTGKFLWSDSDPISGINIPVWKQLEYDISCSEEADCTALCKDSYNGQYIGSKRGNKCYAYKVINLINNYC